MRPCIDIVRGRIRSERRILLFSMDGVEFIGKYRIFESGLVRYDHIDERISFILGDIEGDKFISLDYEVMKSSEKKGVKTYYPCVLYLIDKNPLYLINFYKDHIYIPVNK